MSSSGQGMAAVKSADFQSFVGSISVVVATYNRLSSLRELLDDLSKQSGLKPWPGATDNPLVDVEVVVVDDGGEAPVLESLSPGAFPFRLETIRRTNGGPGAARDTGIRRASGDIVVILDDDMAIPPEFLAAHQRAHSEGASVVLGSILPPRSGTLPLFERFHMEGIQKFGADFRAGLVEIEGTRLCTGNVSFRRSAYLLVGGFDLSLNRCEDRDLGIRFEFAGLKFAVADDGWSEHRSDHEDVGTWRRRCQLYGELDMQIAAKHPDRPRVSPWAFLPKLPWISRPLVVAAALFPYVGSQAAGLAYGLGGAADRAKCRRMAMVGVSLCYAFEYFSGVGSELSRRPGRFSVPKSLVESWRQHFAARKVSRA